MLCILPYNLCIFVIGNGEYETDQYQVLPQLEKWNWAQYSDYVRSKLDTIDPALSDSALNYTFAQSLVSMSYIYVYTPLS